MSFLDTCKRIVTDPHPERNETHAATRYGLYAPELPLQPELPPAEDTLAQKFAAFDKENFAVFIAIRNEALRRWEAGAEYISMKGIFESLRGNIGGGVMLNNSYTSFYTDKLISYCPHLAPCFHRRARAKGKMALHYARAR